MIPVNPGHREILGQPCYRSPLGDSAGRRDRHRGRLPPLRGGRADVADEAIARGVGFFFMQQGVVDAESARRLEAAGIPVAMDRCILVEHEPPRPVPAKTEFVRLDARSWFCARGDAPAEEE